MREFDQCNVFDEGLYGVRFIEGSSYQESTVFMCFFPRCNHQLFMIKIVCRSILLENVSNFEVYKEKSSTGLFKMFTKGRLSMSKKSSKI